MELTPNFEDGAVRALYEATLNGSVSALNTLNPFSLSRVSFSPFRETPLHVASLLGYLELCVVLLDINPRLASEVDSEGRCPLHLASTEGHTEIVKALLMANPDVSLAPDKDDMLPLHLAVSRGHVEVIEELTSARPCSIRKMTDDGSVLHMCVRYNHLEALKFLVQSVRGTSQQLLHAKDKEGNTVLHLAVRLKQIQTIKYLLSLPEMRTAANALNRRGLTALDVLESCPRDFVVGIAIDYILTEAGVQRYYSTNNANIILAAKNSPKHAREGAAESVRQPSSRWKKWEKFWSKYLQYQGNWMEETRGTLMVVATVIATMTFQSALNPPGGVWQENTHTGGYSCTTYGICKAGTAIVGYDWSEEYVKFMSFNTISFFASLCVVLVLVCGFPLKNKVIMWILTIAMTIAITFMLLTYMWALGLVTPAHIYYDAYRLGYIYGAAWGILLVVIALIQIARLVFWINKIRKKKKLHK